MRTISSFMNVTVDGYFEGPNHDISFFKGDDEDNEFFNEQTKDGGGATLLLGHRTYDMMKSFWPTEEGKRSNPDMARFMNEMPKIVVSHKTFEPGWNRVTVLSGDVIDQIRKLKATPGTPIQILGSNSLCVSLLDADLIDEFQIMVNPVALGTGTPLFKGLSGKTDLHLMKSRQFHSGKAVHIYEPAHSTAAAER